MFRIANIAAPLALGAVTLIASPLFAQKIGSRLTVSTAGDVAGSCVSFAPSSSEFLIVWSRRFSGHDQVRAQRIGSDGAYKGSPIPISVGFNEKGRPTVAYVAKTQRWLVAWPEKVGGTWLVRGRSVQPATGTASLSLDLAAGPADALEAALAGDRTAQGDEAILVWRVQNGGIRSRTIEVPASGLPKLGGVQLVTANNVDREPAISSSGGKLRRFVVSWTREKGSSDDIFATALGADAQPLGTAIAVASSSSDDGHVAVDGDGERFFVAWQRRQSTGPSGNHDLYGRMLRHDGSKAILDGSVLALRVNAATDERQPAVAFLSSKFTLAWSQQKTALDYDIAFRSFDARSASACGAENSVVGLRQHDVTPMLASQYAGGGDTDHALLVFVSEDPAASFRGALNAQRFEAVGQGGVITDLGGGCGSGGLLAAKDSLVVGNSAFRLEVHGASPASSLAIFNVTTLGPPILNCGGCAIANPMLLLGAPVVAGASKLPLPVPCDSSLANGSVQFQCLILGSGSSPCVALPGYAFSNRLERKIGK